MTGLLIFHYIYLIITVIIYLLFLFLLEEEKLISAFVLFVVRKCLCRAHYDPCADSELFHGALEEMNF